ncbi:MAG: integrase core domain-containing protein [Akkermansiaceae bacterium]
MVIAAWRKKFNQIRPHRSLSMKTPEEFAFGWRPGESYRTQHASYAPASGLRSGSMLTERCSRLSIGSDPLTLSGP